LLPFENRLTAQQAEPQPAAQQTADESTPDDDLPRDGTRSVPDEEGSGLDEQVRAVFDPLFKTIREAPVSRTTVQVLADSLVNGKVIDSRESTYQIASSAPEKFTIYLKEPEQRTRIYSDGKDAAIAFSPEAYVKLDAPLSVQQAVTQLPVPMGVYPEPVLALSLAGFDPAISLVAGMESIELVDRDKFRGKVDAVHLRGVQQDNVTWDLWIARGDRPRPLRLLIDLTAMLQSTKEFDVPPGFSYQVRCDFLSWRMSGEIDSSLFTYKPSDKASEYESLEAYYSSVAGVNQRHPLLGKKAPVFTTTTLEGEPFDSQNLDGKVVVIDFWATWCKPCVTMMPILQDVTAKFKDKDVVLLAINVGEDKQTIESFLEANPVEQTILLDTKETIADSFVAEALPQTVVIGKDGTIESIHVGFVGSEGLTQRLTDELDVLTVGGRIESSGANE